MTDTSTTKDNRITVSGKLVPGKDDDLIEKWQAVPDGEGINVLKDALALYFQLPPTKRRNPIARLVDDVGRVIKLLEELKQLVQQLLQRPVSYGGSEHIQTVDPELERLANERDQNMKKNQW